MKQNRLGKTSMVVSEICLGTMTFGSQADEKTSFAIMDKAYEAGIDFFDTAEVYPVPPNTQDMGKTEAIVGKWLKTKDRYSVILASKIAGPGHGWIKPPVRAGKSSIDRFSITRAVEGSLKRLDTDYLDLYQVHWPDHGTPLEPVLRAFDDLIQQGKIRAIGCSNETAYGLTKALGVSERTGLARFETIQNNHSLNNRRFEDELATVCKMEQVSAIPYSPIGGGVLTGKYNDGFPAGSRFSNYKAMGGRQLAMLNRFVNPLTIESTKRFMKIAEDIGISPATMAVAWSKQHDYVASTIVGATRPDHLDAILAAVNVKLDQETLTRIDQVSHDIRYPMG